jgi:hypothetical protein
VFHWYVIKRSLPVFRDLDGDHIIGGDDLAFLLAAWSATNYDS